MGNNTKLLIIFSFLAVLLGFSLILLGLKPAEVVHTPLPSIVAQVSPSPITEASFSAALGVDGERAVVTRVVDGDTIDVEIGGIVATIRFVGMDTPETVDPRRPVGCFGKEASNETKSLLSGKEVILQKDVSETDKYKRLLRYVYLPLPDGQTLFVNDYLVREGYARVLTYPPDVRFDSEFKQAEQEARQQKKGLWGKC